ncbi:short-chain dehydrogenase [Stachybotrys elegans]|uniref:Short-chain dehydrogenase n=1 Tax=Stachybotrys elegans TaxID=80388 RepID=A0A8K0SVG9_9HYPO|nr:short-chain dehydrogenase [Stachybotrys elegans]
MTSKGPYNLPSDAVWLITGSSAGMGLALAKLIAAHPTNRLVATARNLSKLAQVLPIDSPRVLTVALDVTDEESIASALDSALKTFGRIDVFVNNAGFGLLGDAESALQPEDKAKARSVMETNYWGTVNVTLQALRVLRDENPKTGQQGGVILNVTSVGGFSAYPGNAFYHAAKFAVEGFTLGISKDVRPDWNIHLCIMQPGGTKTDFLGEGLGLLSPHPAYKAPDTPARFIEAWLKAPGTRETFVSAESAAEAMYRTVSRGKAIPDRVPTDYSSWKTIREEAENIGRGLDGVKELGLWDESSPLVIIPE